MGLVECAFANETRVDLDRCSEGGALTKRSSMVLARTLSIRCLWGSVHEVAGQRGARGARGARSEKQGRAIKLEDLRYHWSDGTLYASSCLEGSHVVAVEVLYL
jgi:hypothetical protein